MAKCFVIQPFDKGPYDKRYADILKPAIIDAGLEPYRVDEDPSVAVPIEEIESGIRNAEICLADVTTNNPNIWYEVGFAMANGRPVVLICAEPRTEPYPFDIRHRHIISYATQSSSDFDKLRKEVTARLKAQAEKAEKLQTVAAMSQIKTTEGLLPHEVGLLITILSAVWSPADGMPTYQIKDSMKRSGYTSMASTLALAALGRKGMVEFDTVRDREGDSIPIVRVAERGLAWMLENQDQFHMRTKEGVKPMPEPDGQAPIRDEDIPF